MMMKSFFTFTVVSAVPYTDSNGCVYDVSLKACSRTSPTKCEIRRTVTSLTTHPKGKRCYESGSVLQEDCTTGCPPFDQDKECNYTWKLECKRLTSGCKQTKTLEASSPNKDIAGLECYNLGSELETQVACTCPAGTTGTITTTAKPLVATGAACTAGTDCETKLCGKNKTCIDNGVREGNTCIYEMSAFGTCQRTQSKDKCEKTRKIEATGFLDITANCHQPWSEAFSAPHPTLGVQACSCEQDRLGRGRPCDNHDECISDICDDNKTCAEVKRDDAEGCVYKMNAPGTCERSLEDDGKCGKKTTIAKANFTKAGVSCYSQGNVHPTLGNEDCDCAQGRLPTNSACTKHGECQSDWCESSKCVEGVKGTDGNDQKCLYKFNDWEGCKPNLVNKTQCEQSRNIAQSIPLTGYTGNCWSAGGAHPTAALGKKACTCPACECWTGDQSCTVYDANVSTEKSCWIKKDAVCSDRYRATKKEHKGYFLSYNACKTRRVLAAQI